jgi:hypothetical protein
VGEELISVIDIARQNGRTKTCVFKVVKRLGIQPVKRRSTSRHNQFVACITDEECRLVVAELRAIDHAPRETEADEIEGITDAEAGVFYLIRLEPEFDPGRFKVGFAAGIGERLRQLRCSAPFAEVVATWPCRRLWERTVIDSVTIGTERLHTEVFRARSLDEVIGRCEQFFAVMPPAAEQRHAEPSVAPDPSDS